MQCRQGQAAKCNEFWLDVQDSPKLENDRLGGEKQMKGKINSIYHGRETSSLLIKDVRT